MNQHKLPSGKVVWVAECGYYHKKVQGVSGHLRHCNGSKHSLLDMDLTDICMMFIREPEYIWEGI